MEIRIKPHTEVRKGCGMSHSATQHLRSYGVSRIRKSAVETT